MIAWLLRALWCATIVVAAGAVWLSERLFSATIGPWAAGLLAIMAIGALHPLAIAFNFVMSRINGDAVPAEYRLSPWAMIKAYDAEIDASMRGVWFATPFLGHRTTPQPLADIASQPFALLFIHGYFCNRAVWHSFMRDAASRGYRCEAVTLMNPFASIDSHADAIDRAIDELRDAHPVRVVIVAHSMGGLVARAALQRIDASRVAHVFTLGSPHHGTHTARFGRMTSVTQMGRGSAWLAALAEREINDRSGLPRSAYTTIYSYHDDIVYPQTTGALDGAECVAIGGCGHVALLYDRRVRAIVFERLAALGTASQATGAALAS
jgi:pimeloyl-ACP methyl ester carboxylesterase